MPHAQNHAADFRHYTARRHSVLRQIRELRCYLGQLESVVKATPAKGADAGYLDLDNIEQLAGDLAEATELVCDWESLSDEFSRLGLLNK